MVHTTRDCGKYLTKKWNRDRALALVDRTQFTADELAWLEVGADEGKGEFDPETFMVDTQPVEPDSPTKRYDVRSRPECGDKE